MAALAQAHAPVQMNKVQPMRLLYNEQVERRHVLDELDDVASRTFNIGVDVSTQTLAAVLAVDTEIYHTRDQVRHQQEEGHVDVEADLFESQKLEVQVV